MYTDFEYCLLEADNICLMQADKIEKLEKEHGWREEEFDFILQFMRTILLKRTYFFHIHRIKILRLIDNLQMALH